jgi:hypothetical protein
MNHVVFRRLGMSESRLQEGLNYVYREFYSLRSIEQRLMKDKRNLHVFGPQNLGFRRAWNELLTETEAAG